MSDQRQLIKSLGTPTTLDVVRALRDAGFVPKAGNVNTTHAKSVPCAVFAGGDLGKLTLYVVDSESRRWFDSIVRSATPGHGIAQLVEAVAELMKYDYYLADIDGVSVNIERTLDYLPESVLNHVVHRLFINANPIVIPRTVVHFTDSEMTIPSALIPHAPARVDIDMSVSTGVHDIIRKMIFGKPTGGPSAADITQALLVLRALGIRKW